MAPPKKKLRPLGMPRDEFEDNSRESGGPRPGFSQAEDGSWVPNSYWGGGGGGGIGSDPRWSRAGKPGYVMAEDGTWVPESFYGNDGGQGAIVW